MKILINNVNHRDDTCDFSHDSLVRSIYKANMSCGIGIRIFDDTDYPQRMDYEMGLPVFHLHRTADYEGICFYSVISDEPEALEDQVTAPTALQFAVNPKVFPYLGIDQLVARMPDIPWGNFSDHILLEGPDCDRFMALWNGYLEENLPLFRLLMQGAYKSQQNKYECVYIDPSYEQRYSR